MNLRNQLTRSLTIEGLKPIAVKVRQIDERYWTLHRKCAAGTITDAECDELDLMCAAKEREYHQSQGGRAAQQAPANDL